MSSAPLPARLDYRKLANQGASLEGILPVDNLQRLAALVEGIAGHASVAARFGMDDEMGATVRFAAAVDVELACQNCLGNFTASVTCNYAGLVTENPDQFEAMGQADDAILCEGCELDIAGLVEDELILALPMAPRHAEGDCPGHLVAAGGIAEGEAGEKAPLGTHRPFAGLGEKRQKQDQKQHQTTGDK